MSDDMTPDRPKSGASRRKLLTGMGAAAAGAGVLAVAGTQPAHASITDGTYYSFGPSRYVDTRTGVGSSGPISSGETRTLDVLFGSQLTMAVNLTVVSVSGNGYLALYSTDLATRPTPYSSINWQGAGKVVANLAIFDLANAGFNVYCGGTSASTHFIIDSIGYLVHNGGAAAAPRRQGPPRQR